MIRHSPVKNKFIQPNTTQTPNCFFDYYLRILGHAELKITGAVIRHTYGWHEKDFRFELSLTDFEELTGLGRANVQRAVRRLIIPTKDRPAILGRKKGKNGKYSYWLLVFTADSHPGGVHDTSTGENDRKIVTGVHDTSTELYMKHGQQVYMQHVQPIKVIKKHVKKHVKSSSKVPTTGQENERTDDGSKISVAVIEYQNGDPREPGKPDRESDNVVIRRELNSSDSPELNPGLAALWFAKLSNGNTFSQRRDSEAYRAVAHVRLAHFQLGLAFCIAKSTEHRLGSLRYAVNSILDHYDRTKDMAPSDLKRIAIQSVAKTLWSLKSNIWLADNFTEKQWKVYKAEIMELAQTV